MLTKSPKWLFILITLHPLHFSSETVNDGKCAIPFDKQFEIINMNYFENVQVFITLNEQLFWNHEPKQLWNITPEINIKSNLPCNEKDKFDKPMRNKVAHRIRDAKRTAFFFCINSLA